MKAQRWECEVCGYVYDAAAEGKPWEELDDDWECPVCGAGKDEFVEEAPTAAPGAAPALAPAAAGLGSYLSQWAKPSSEREPAMADVHRMAITGESLQEPMSAAAPSVTWDDILVRGAQLATLPLNDDEPVSTRTIIGPRAAHPLAIDMPVYVTHMSFGALSREVKIALAKGSAAVRTATCSGEGGILPEELEAAHKYIFEYVPRQYSVSADSLARADAIEIKIGQSAKPGMGGHLPADKVTPEIAAIRQVPLGEGVTSPARYPDITDAKSLRDKIAWLRELSGGKPIGVKLAAGHIEADLAVALQAGPDFVTIDGRPGATGAAPKMVKNATSVPTVFALARARRVLTDNDALDVSLVITGGLRTSADFAKALALGADAIAIGSAALMACGCQQYRVCHTGKCPVGIATQDPELRARFNVEHSAQRLENYLQVCRQELAYFCRLTGNRETSGLTVRDLATTHSEIARQTPIDLA